MSSAERWAEVERIYHAALEQARETRAAFLATACAGDEQLREEVESLLVHDDGAKDFLEQGALDLAARDWVASAEPDELATGTLVGAYRIVDCVGRGGMGMVYRAEQQAPVRRMVALKMIKAGMDSRQVIARFEAERQALAMMDHPNIARVYDAGTAANGRHYFVMELVEGESITAYCRRNACELRERVALLVPVCQAIEHAHQKGIIHRDIKPSNLLVATVDGKPMPKVIDFGIAKAIQEPLTPGGMRTVIGTVMGTPEYMSPEQADSLGADIDTRSDVYALGAVLYELITGTTPLLQGGSRQTSQTEIIRQIREVVAATPSAVVEDERVRRQVRGDLDWVVMKALEKDRARRYASVSALGQDLENYLAGKPVHAGPPSAAYRLRKFASRHRNVVGTVALAAVLLIVAAVVSIREAIHARRAQQEAAAVIEFLQQDLLAQASASVQASSSGKPDPDLKVRTALDRAAARIGGRFDGHPLVEAAVRHTIGATYLDLGLHAEARRQLERAIELRRGALGTRAAETLQSENLLVKVLLGQAQPAAAEELARRVLEQRRAVLGPRHPDTLASLDNVAATQRALGRDAQAEKLYAEVAELRKQILGPDHPDTLRSLNQLAFVSMLLEKYSQAVEIHTRILDTRRRLFGEEHPDTMQSRHSLALALLNNGQPERAEELLHAVLDWRRRVLGLRHADTLNVLNALGLAITGQGKFAQAVDVFRSCMEESEQALGRHHSIFTACASNVADVYEGMGNYDEAVRGFRSVLDSDREHLGEESPNTLRSMSNFAIAAGLAGRYDEARGLFARVIELRKRVLGPKNPKTLSSMDARAALEQRQGRYAVAETLFREVAGLRREVLGAKHPNTLASLTGLAEAMLEQGKYREAEPILREVLEATGTDAWASAWRRSLLGWCLMGLNRESEGRPMLQAGYAALVERKDQRSALERWEMERIHRRLR